MRKTQYGLLSWQDGEKPIKGQKNDNIVVRGKHTFVACLKS